jgi:hypothetical protein
MLVIFITLAILIIASIVLYIEEHRYYGNDYIVFTAALFLILSAMGLVISCGFIIGNHATAPAEKAQLEADYEILTTLYENDTFNTDSDAIGNSDLYNNISEYNRKVVAGRANQNSLWLNWFTPHIYDDLELIYIN